MYKRIHDSHFTDETTEFKYLVHRHTPVQEVLGPGYEPRQYNCKGLLTNHKASVALPIGIWAAILFKGQRPQSEHGMGP